MPKRPEEQTTSPLITPLLSVAASALSRTMP